MKFFNMETWSDSCRCCLSTDSSVSLLSDRRKKQFFKTTSLKIEDGDGLPVKLCNDCFSLMLSAYQFRSKCIKTDKKLRLQLQLAETDTSFTKCILPTDTEIGATEDLMENLGDSPMKELESIIKQNSNDDDDNFFYVFVVDKENNEAYEGNEKESSETVLIKEEDSLTNESNLGKKAIKNIKKDSIDSLPYKSKFFHAPATFLKNESKNVDDKIDKCTDIKYTFQHNQAESDPSKPYSCHYCIKAFETPEILEGHSLLHKTKAWLLTCPFCKENVKRPRIIRHIKIKHTETRPECVLCKKTFATYYNLCRHMLIHSGVKDFECNICKKRFAQKFTLQTHMKTHNFLWKKSKIKDEKKMVPAVSKKEEKCLPKSKLKTITQKKVTNAIKKEKHIEMTKSNVEFRGDLRSKRRHGVNTKNNAKVFSCKICGKETFDRSKMNKHEKTHSKERPFVCQHCPLSFKLKHHVRAHELTHTRDKVFSCSICDKNFLKKFNLMVHLRCHTRERPYVCSLCGQAYVTYKSLQIHENKKHNINPIPLTA